MLTSPGFFFKEANLFIQASLSAVHCFEDGYAEKCKEN